MKDKAWDDAKKVGGSKHPLVAHNVRNRLAWHVRALLSLESKCVENLNAKNTDLASIVGKTCFSLTQSKRCFASICSTLDKIESHMYHTIRGPNWTQDRTSVSREGKKLV